MCSGTLCFAVVCVGEEVQVRRSVMEVFFAAACSVWPGVVKEPRLWTGGVDAAFPSPAREAHDWL